MNMSGLTPGDCLLLYVSLQRMSNARLTVSCNRLTTGLLILIFPDWMCAPPLMVIRQPTVTAGWAF